MAAISKLWRVVFLDKTLVALMAAVGLLSVFNAGQFQTAFANWSPSGAPTVSSRIAAWDVAHYLHLSQEGYAAGSKSCAFYPLWPAAIRVATALLGDRQVLAAMLLTNALSLIGFWMLYRLIERRCGVATAGDSLILMLAFPGALFFSFAYSESLFFALVMLFFWGLELERWAWVGIAGVLLPLTKATGVFVLLPLAWFLYERRSHSTGCSTGVSLLGSRGQDARTTAWKQLAPWLLVLCPLLGYAAYFGLMYVWTGNALEGFDAQKSYPNSPSIKNMFNYAGFGSAFLNVQTLEGMMDSALDRACFLLFLALLVPIYRLNKMWFFYVLPAGLVPALSSWFMSYRRYIMVLFPMFVVLAQLQGKARRRWLFWYYVALLAALQAWAVKQFVCFRWAG